MPAVIVHYPRGCMDPTDKERFKRTVKLEVAAYMDAVDPATQRETQFAADPNAFIDLVLVPYEPDDAEVTTPFMATIITYQWPDRMKDIDHRIEAITNRVRAFGFTTDMGARWPKGKELISFTFLGKQPGAWAAA